jgi:predicted enzyme related to lactoylglutathione lyase
MVNSVVRWQIVASEPEKVADFYSRLFGWKVTADNALGYRQFETGNGISGGVWPRGEEGQNLVQVYVEVDDIDAYLAKAQGLGARVLVPRQQLPDGDALALLIDPAGLSVGLYTPATAASRASASSSRR